MSVAARSLQPERTQYSNKPKYNDKPLSQTAIKESSVVALQTVRIQFPKKSMVFGVIVSFCLCFLILYRYGVLAEMNLQLGKMNRECAVLKDSGRMLKVDIESSIQLDRVRELAKNEYAMHEPISNQIIPVSIPKSQYSVIKDPTYINELSDAKRTFFTWALDSIGAALP